MRYSTLAVQINTSNTLYIRDVSYDLSNTENVFGDHFSLPLEPPSGFSLLKHFMNMYTHWAQLFNYSFMQTSNQPSATQCIRNLDIVKMICWSSNRSSHGHDCLFIFYHPQLISLLRSSMTNVSQHISLHHSDACRKASFLHSYFSLIGVQWR